MDYGHLMGHFKKALSYSLEDNDQNVLDELILAYIAKKEEIQNAPTQPIAVEESQALSDLKLSNGRVYNYDDINDPVVHRGKGRRPNKRLKGFNEETSKASSSKTQQASYDNVDSDGEPRRKCGLCYKSGHYAARCPNKENTIMLHDYIEIKI
ncbi:hypothetical protein C2G38_2218255 [Gigaspora rosea]|uniref:CCHC-type domain-containing protein n=1 Tax=Gigaspora rosea TaxID=44941 RepID=A0A397UF82_9GLOM|nr:hypothetical protein C2G38_2218255 [Gigaspora rosea]